MIAHVDNRITYSGNGNATEFAYQFKILDRTDIKVMLVKPDGSTQILSKDYYVDVEKNVVIYPGYAPGAEIPESERPPVLPAGWRLVLYREVPITQLVHLPEIWPFNVIETMADKLTIICQQLKDKLSRALTINESSASNIDTTVPWVPGKTFRVSDDGTHLQATEDPGKVIDEAKGLLAETTIKAEETATNAQEAKQAAAEIKTIYNSGGLTPITDLAGSIGTVLKRWGYIFANKVFAMNLPIVYKSVAEMKADSLLSAGMTACTLGYYAPNDGGTAMYIIRAKQASDVDDGGSLHALANGNVAELVVENGTVCPEQFGAKGDGSIDDRIAIQNAVNSGEKVILIKTYRITSTITDVKNIYIDKKAIIVIDNDVDGFYMTGDNNVINGAGTIRVNVDNYTHAVIKVIGPSKYCCINDITIEGKEYANPKGVGIYFDSLNGRHFAHRITCTIQNFNIGIYINAQTWCNNFYFNIVANFNNVSIFIDGDKESSGHHCILQGQCARYSKDGCAIRTINLGASDSFWDMHFYDTGNEGNNTLLLDIASGYAIIRRDDINKCKYRGDWRSNFSPLSVKTIGSSLVNAVGKDWLITEAIGNASELQKPPVVFSGSTSGLLAHIGYMNKTNGVRYTFNLPTPLVIDYLTFIPETDTKNPDKIIIKLESSKGTQEVEIDGFAIGNGRTFLADELFTWQYYYNCTKIVLEVIGMKLSNSGEYTRLLYFGVFDHYERILE